MRGARIFGAVFAASLGLLVTAGSGTAATNSTPDLSSLAAIDSYLVSKGFDPSTFVHQVGMNNYAGPAASCPGIGWNCTTALRVVQLAFPGGQNSMECDGDDHMSKKRECVGVQSKGSTNTFTCRETSNETAATETCGPYTQSGDTNHAHIKQVVTQQSNVADTTQTAAESADLTQNGTVRNDVDVLQLVRQTIGTTAEHDPSTQVANNSAAIRQ